MSHQSVATNSRPNSQSVKIHSDITHIYAETEVHHGHVGEEKERGGFGERNRVIHVQPTTLFYLSGNEILSGLKTVVGTLYP